MLTRTAPPIERAHTALFVLGVPTKTFEPLFDPEVSVALHRQPPEDTDGFTVLRRVSDPAQAMTILEESWEPAQRSMIGTLGMLKRIGPSAFDLLDGKPPIIHGRLTGASLLVTTLPGLADTAASLPSGSWLPSADHLV